MCLSAPAPPQTLSPLPPADLASELTQYNATEPASTPSTTITDAGHIAPGTTNRCIPVVPGGQGSPLDLILLDFDEGVGMVSCKVDRTNRN